jgi:hypothetical protein
MNVYQLLLLTCTNLTVESIQGDGLSVSNTEGIQANRQNTLLPAGAGAADQNDALLLDAERDMLPEPDVRHILVKRQKTSLWNPWLYSNYNISVTTGPKPLLGFRALGY